MDGLVAIAIKFAGDQINDFTDGNSGHGRIVEGSDEMESGGSAEKLE